MNSSVPRLKIVADEMLSVSWLEEYFPVQVVSLPGRSIEARDVVDCDGLLVRSVTRVDRQLIESSKVRYIGTATIGTDHVDLELLSRNGIHFAHAPGCNANAVVDYVMSCLFNTFALQELSEIVVGILGYGNVGYRLAGCLTKWGISCRVYDPFVDVPAGIAACSPEQVLTSDVVSLHVPLTQNRQHATHHFIDESVFAMIGENCKLLVNSSRGQVVCSKSLEKFLQRNRQMDLALDVWEEEPHISLSLLDKVTVPTGHIAGYSSAGKLRGVSTVVGSLFSALHLSPLADVSVQSILEKELNVDALIAATIDSFDTLKSYRDKVQEVFSVQSHVRDFRQAMSQAAAQNTAKAFDDYRRSYPLRGEIDYTPLLSARGSV